MRAQGPGILVDSCCGDDPDVATGVRISGNSLGSIADGIVLFETDRTLVIGNTVIGAGTFGDPETLGVGIALDGVNDARIDRNAILDGRGPGIQIGSEQDPSARPIAGNLVTRNSADRNGADGIDIVSPLTTVSRNSANRNAGYGIEAVPGVTDGGSIAPAATATPRSVRVSPAASDRHAPRSRCCAAHDQPPSGLRPGRAPCGPCPEAPRSRSPRRSP